MWKRATETNERKLDDKLRAFVATINQASDDENAEYGDRDLEELGAQAIFTSDDVKSLAAMLNERIAALDDTEESKPVKKN